MNIFLIILFNTCASIQSMRQSMYLRAERAVGFCKKGAKFQMTQQLF